MKNLQLIRDGITFNYKTQDGTLVSFQECTLGKYRGKTFMSVYGETVDGELCCIEEKYLLEVTKQIKFHTQGRTRILEEIEVDETPYSRADVFYNIARKTAFTINDGNEYVGYTFNQYWNGWDCPYFTKEIAMEICKEFSYKYDEVEECRCYYDEETDTFYCEDYNCDYEKQEIGHPTEINTEDGVIKVYDFGYAGWIWSEVD